MTNQTASKKSAASISGISVDAIMARNNAIMPSLRKLPITSTKVPTLRGIPQDLILRTLAEETSSAPLAFRAKEYIIQYVAPNGVTRVGAKVAASGVRAALRGYLATRGNEGERLHVRKVGGREDGTLVGLYRAERGSWKVIAAFAAQDTLV